MANAKEIVGDVHKVLAGISTGVVGIFGGPAAAQGIQTASGAVQGMIEKYVPGEEEPPASKKSPVPPSTKSPVAEPSRAAKFDQTDFKSKTSQEVAQEKHDKRIAELRARLRAAQEELRTRTGDAKNVVGIVDLNPTEKKMPLVDDARSARSVRTADGTLLLDLGPMGKQTDAQVTVDHLRTLGYSENEIDQLLAGPATGAGAPARNPIAFKTLEIYGESDEGRLVPLLDAIEQAGGRWRPRARMAVKVAHTSEQGFGLAGSPGRWPEEYRGESPELYGLHKERAVLYWDAGRGKSRVATAGLLSDLFSDWQKTFDQV